MKANATHFQEEELTWLELQSDSEQLFVARMRGGRPAVGGHDVLVRVIAAGVCGADTKVGLGLKALNCQPERWRVPGHEAVAEVIAIGPEVKQLRLGDVAVILPHIERADHADICSRPEQGPRCKGLGHTLHMGMEVNGVFTSFAVFPEANVHRVDPRCLEAMSGAATDLPDYALFAVVEPLMCCLAGYRLMQEATQRLQRTSLKAGRALVVGAGPVGLLNGLVLKKKGWRVAFTDPLHKRVAIAENALGGRVMRRDGATYDDAYDLVVVTAPTKDAVKMAEERVREYGLVYLFAGLVAPEKEAMDEDHVVFYESIHRKAQAVQMPTRLAKGEKIITYAGHSGYFEAMADEAVEFAANNVRVIDRLVTSVIRGLDSPAIESRFVGGAELVVEDGSPIVVPVLRGMYGKEPLCKLLIVPVDLRGWTTNAR